VLRAYLQLLRPANVATALADVLAGFAIAGLENPGALMWLLPSTAALYAGGVVLNDYFDREVDARERPERPIPRGLVQPVQAAWLGALLLGAGVVLASLANATAALVAAGIAGTVVLYDAWGKRHPVIGPLNMGACRGLNLVLGIAASPSAVGGSWPLGLLSLTYIAGVTILSRGEVFGGRREVAGVSLGLTAAVLTALAILTRRPGQESLAGLLLTIFLAWRVLPAFWAAFRRPEPGVIRHAVKRGVLSLVLLDAVLAASYGTVSYSVLVLATGLLAGWLARRFAVT
jgi:4-hydroxybenzoate polyprenyltransferase